MHRFWSLVEECDLRLNFIYRDSLTANYSLFNTIILKGGQVESVRVYPPQQFLSHYEGSEGSKVITVTQPVTNSQKIAVSTTWE